MEMSSDYQAFFGVDGIVNDFHVNRVHNTNFYGVGGDYSNGVHLQVQLSPNQYSNLLKYGYSGKKHNVYFAVRSNNHAHLYAASTEDINKLLEVISN
ncbi:hypothetical protein M1D49_03685 [Bacillus sp. PK3-056]|uniref:hypothetical protein n=1 Tax=Niallia circulans TaxID=1397 RepID=UPI000F453410|nr:hypothetical protein [Niallia circulans]AYV73526.1 hypothetical protein C2H98_19270 [Niallia circulans]UQZ75839.1 hypothetical protein C2I17_15480 [Niallia circulans]